MRWFIVVAVSVVILLGCCLASREYNTSICVNTGMTRFTRTYGPFKMHTIQPTALSQVLTNGGYRDPNQHDWVYEHGGGWILFRRRYSASGNALSLRQSLESPQVAAAFRLLIAHTDKSTVDKWLQRVFDPDISPQVSFYLYDVEEHTNRQGFIRWLGERDNEFMETHTNR